MNMCANLSKTINAIKWYQTVVGRGRCVWVWWGGGECIYRRLVSERSEEIQYANNASSNKMRWCHLYGLWSIKPSTDHVLFTPNVGAGCCLPDVGLIINLLGSPRLDTSKGHTYVLRNSEQDWEADQGNVESRLLRIYITAVQANTQTLHLWPVCLSYDSMEIKFICSPSRSSQM